MVLLFVGRYSGKGFLTITSLSLDRSGDSMLFDRGRNERRLSSSLGVRVSVGVVVAVVAVVVVVVARGESGVVVGVVVVASVEGEPVVMAEGDDKDNARGRFGDLAANMGLAVVTTTGVSSSLGPALPNENRRMKVGLI